jgi:F-type H+-transporting ATPase subunit delta
MKLSKQNRRDSKALFRVCRPNGVLDEARVRQTVTEVLSRKPRGYVAILSHLQRLVKLDLERRTACVENAVDFTEAQKTAICSTLSARYGTGLDVQFRVAPELIGGIRVKVGSDVYDGSVKARLAALEDSF